MVQPVGDLGPWHAQVQEEIVEPERPIVDPHHHLWHALRFMPSYLLEDLWADTGSGHNIVETGVLECAAEYRTEGPEHLRPIGETEFVADIAAQSAKGGPGKARIAGIVAPADLQLGEAVEQHWRPSRSLDCSANYFYGCCFLAFEFNYLQLGDALGQASA